jgi:NAD(P)-dependent dehydrogenase (short-subunit alcohol dehydrogenase family)
MSNPVVLITGALTGIGRATAFAFAKEGARVVVSGRRDDVGEALAVELRATGAEAEFVRADVRHEPDVQNLIDKKAYGGMVIEAGGRAAENIASTPPA